ncbi:protein arginine N-methyltransferase 6-like isoform X2 [Mya arenaria]|uniref:protein arginine N-methyltransferase 6-like isoform X2 n=1 Tax=Mya arenaria TaxID=6604 RepID=UPI0022E1EDE3|nr:protein arginine N-methyltransferase 6-like isoform X2 [Mya arenaria]
MTVLDNCTPKGRRTEDEKPPGEEADRKRQRHDCSYFKSYADIGVHEEMLSDTVRTNAYRYAIFKNYERLRGSVVADVGAGTGILSVFCVQAGAKKVYAIEASDIAGQTEAVVNENKMAERIDVIHNAVESVKFPEQLDVIVSEWMGYCLFYESMLPSVIHCRDRWLKQGGLMFPSTATLYIAPFYDAEYDNRLEFWSEIRSVYKLSMESMKSYAKQSIAKQVHVNTIPPEAIQAHAQKVCHLDLLKVQASDLENVKGEFRFECFGRTQVHGFCTWFDVGFPEGVTLTTSPYAEETHWSQTAFYVDEPFPVDQEVCISGSIHIRPHREASRFLDISITHQVNNGPKHTRKHLMNDCFV